MIRFTDAVALNFFIYCIYTVVGAGLFQTSAVFKNCEMFPTRISIPIYVTADINVIR
jgi:hypothetical protein